MKKEVLDWLLEDNNPAIRYRTLIEICDESPERFQDCYSKIWEQKQIAKLFSSQDENGLWVIKDIRDANSITHLTMFAEYGLRQDRQLDKYVEYIIDLLKTWKKDNIDVFSCYAPIALRALVMLGYHEKTGVKELILEFASSQIYDGGFMCKRNLNKKPERKSCYKAAISGLLLYAECKRKNILLENATNLINYFLKRDVFFSSDKTISFVDAYDKPKGFGPMKIGIPLIVAALSILGAGNSPEIQKAWTMMHRKENEKGRYLQAGSAKQAGIFGKDGYENKWATFYALLAQKYRNINNKIKS